MNQKDATVNAVLATLKERDVEYEMGGEVPVSEVLSEKDRADIRAYLFAGFRSDEIDMKAESKAKHDDDAELKRYVSGLLNNWIRKYKPFNCGQVYVTKNPGSRAHVQDKGLTELRKLSQLCAGDEKAQAEIVEAMVKRKAEITVEKAKVKPIMIDALPEHLRHLVNKK